MNAIWILTKLTFREAMRRRIMLAGLVLGISFLIIYSLGLHFILDQISLAIKAAATENPSVNQSISNVGKVESMNGFLMAGLYAVTFLSIAMAALLGRRYPRGRDQFRYSANHRHQAHSTRRCRSWKMVRLCWTTRALRPAIGRRHCM